ncbi:hypothetical protein [Spirulina sp. 06S082]|uniref:hypothetical protein n=1 Tax=Spirulina sp. 06S082 TaxID=3110248 RepID=UPI002B1F8512|nr:hypothetical protein [Spirulina sp. 06S082]MEA5472439.1 hypothetical protein [Spirulina sp. 06S082]
MNAKLPDGYRDRLCGLLQAEWRGGESYTKFATRLDLGSGRTVKAWLTLDFRAEPDPQKLRKLAHHLGWEHWQLMRYLDTGEHPDSLPLTSENLTTENIDDETAPNVLSALQQMSDLATKTIQLVKMLPSPEPTLPQPNLLLAKPPALKNLPQAIAYCIEKSRQTPTQIEDRIRDIRYYGSSEVKITLEEFEAIRQGKVLPTNEATMEAIADIVDRDREVFTIQEWLSTWIVSIYTMSAKRVKEEDKTCSSVNIAS